MDKYKPYAFLFLAAVLYTLGFPNLFKVYLPFAPILATTILIYYLFKSVSTKERIIFYLFYNSIINILSFYWITNTLHEFGNIPVYIAMIGNALFAFIFNPQYFVLIFILYWTDRLPKLKESYFKWGLFNVLLAALLTTLEYFLPQQFPVMLGQPWIIISEYLGAARYLGLPIFSFMSYLLALEIIRAIRLKRFSYINLFSILIFIIINPFLMPLYQQTQHKELNTRLVQANISNFLKVDSESGAYHSVEQVLERYYQLSTAPYPEGKKLDIIIWPETAYPYPITKNKLEIKDSSLPKMIEEIVHKQKSYLLFGGYEHIQSSTLLDHFESDYNASLLVNRDGKLAEIYHKHVLIPFGETLPLGPLTKFASQYIPEMAFFAVGTKWPLFRLDNGIHFISSICYEILRPEFMREYLNTIASKPDLMINITNDSWYGDTVEPEQHLFLTRWRALEFGLPILRSTNSGISSYIDALGRETTRLGYNKSGNLDLSIKLAKNSFHSTPTFFQTFGFWGIIPLWLLYFIFHTILIKLKYD